MLIIKAQRTIWLAFALTLGFGLAIDPQTPWTDDARFYVPAAAAYGQWLADAAVGVVTLDGGAWSRARLDTTFGQNREHPPVGKYVMGLTWLVGHRLFGMDDEVFACRLGVLLLWSWVATLIFSTLRRERSWLAGAVGAGCFVLLPRVLFDGHAETLDMPVAAFMTLTVLQTFDHLEQPTLRSGVWAVLWFALALGTKHNAPFFFGGAGLYWLLTTPPQLNRLQLRLPAVPLVFVAQLVLGPLLVWLLWPWLWFDTLPRLLAYAQYHLQHYGIYFYYQGVIYSDPVAPWHAPAMMLLLTTPLTMLFLVGVGIANVMTPKLRRVPGFVWLRTTHETDRGQRLGLFVLLQALLQVVAVSLPGVPSYGGVKLFLPAFPMLALLSGLGFAQLEAQLRQACANAVTAQRLCVLTGALLLLPNAIGVIAYRGAWLSYYNELAGGVRGAAASGYEQQYYDLAYPQLVDDLTRALPHGGRVAFLPNGKEYGPYLNRWQTLGVLPRALQLVPPERADVLVLTHERRWREYPALMRRYRNAPMLAEKSVAGVPLYVVLDLRKP